MSVKLLSAVTAETINNLSPDAGILLKNFDYSAATDAETLAELINAEETRKNSWLGPTKGGVNIQENRSFWTPEFDGKRMPYKGDKNFESAEPKITGTLVEIRPENVKMASGAADLTTNGNVVTVQPHASIQPGDYLDNVVWVANRGADGLYLVELKNALCVSGINSQSTDKDILTMPFEFTGHADNVVYSDDLPIKYLFFMSGTAATASEEGY